MSDNTDAGDNKILLYGVAPLAMACISLTFPLMLYARLEDHGYLITNPWLFFSPWFLAGFVFGIFTLR